MKRFRPTAKSNAPGRPTYSLGPEQPKEVMRALKGRGLKWQAGVTSKLAQDDCMLELAAESGCTLLSIGFESISRKMVKSVHKHVNQPDQSIAARGRRAIILGCCLAF
jgi:hypothetical protein